MEKTSTSPSRTLLEDAVPKPIFNILKAVWHAWQFMTCLPWGWRGYIRHEEGEPAHVVPHKPDLSNPLQAHFLSVTEGHGIWKWHHYFDIYHRHFDKFRGRDVRILEIGVFSGGSLEMWRGYFGPQCRVYGVDVQESCKAYESEGVEILIGDQGDRDFWRCFKARVPPMDIVVDDGGHEPNQQMVTLEELLPHIRPGGIYLCEDVFGTFNPFSFYVNGLANNLNAGFITGNPNDPDRRQVTSTTVLQSRVRSVTTYPYVVVIELHDDPLAELVSSRRGTLWEPFMR